MFFMHNEQMSINPLDSRNVKGRGSAACAGQS
jgi:hypothetical protein